MASKNGNRPGQGAAHSAGFDDDEPWEPTHRASRAQLARPTWSDIEHFNGSEYCEPFEDALTTAIHEVISFASTCKDRPDAVMVRPTETISALVNVLARYISMEPGVSPTRIRKGVEKITRHLRILATDMAGDTPKEEFQMLGNRGRGWL